MVMVLTEVVKVTSKGQITLPVDIRKTFKIEKDGYLMVDVVGDYILMKKAEIRMDEINKLISEAAKKKKIKRKDIEEMILKARREVWAE